MIAALLLVSLLLLAHVGSRLLDVVDQVEGEL
jgi:hypothetical protein